MLFDFESDDLSRFFDNVRDYSYQKSVHALHVHVDITKKGVKCRCFDKNVDILVFSVSERVVP